MSGPYGHTTGPIIVLLTFARPEYLMYMDMDVVGMHSTYTVEIQSFASGSHGTIHRTADPRFVYKRYKNPAQAPTRGNLDQLVLIGRDVSVVRGLTAGATPESSINWPVDIIPGPDGDIHGVILPVAPATLFSKTGVPRGLDLLLTANRQQPLAKGRVAILLRLAEILAYLDARKLVHGDISGKNVVWAVKPEPTVYLIDCDSLLPQNPPPKQPFTTPNWQDPRFIDHHIRAHDHRSDHYALALAIYRGLTLSRESLTAKNPDGTWPKPSKIPPTLDAQLAAQLHQALDDPLNDDRPQPALWVQALLGAFIPHGVYNDEALDELDAAALSAPAAFTAIPAADWSLTTGSTQPGLLDPQKAQPVAADPPKTAPAAPRRSRRKLPLIAAATAAILVIVLVAFIVSRNDGSPLADPSASPSASASPSDAVAVSLPTATTSSDPGTAASPTPAVPPPRLPSPTPPANAPPGVSPPAMPTNLTATAISSSTIRLRWTDNSPDETGFELRNGIGSTHTVGPEVTSYDWTGIAPATFMCFVVSSHNSGGQSGWYPSSSPYWVCTTTPGPPTAPSGLTATATGTSVVHLQWTDNSGDETGFEIADSSATTHTVGAGSTQYDWTGLSAGTTVCFHVRAYNSNGSSAYSPASASVCAKTAGPPAAPTNFTVTQISASTVRLQWTDNADNETGYLIDTGWAIGSLYSGGGARSVGANVTSYDWNLPDGSWRCFTLTASNSNGYSGASPQWTCAPGTSHSKPASPTGISATAISSTSIRIQWTDNSNNEGMYTIEGAPGGPIFLNPNSTSIQIDFLSHGTQYCFGVGAGNPVGSAGQGNICATTLP